jgi:NADPH-dependent glutamate synthase beta subunit-like oxidoreductase/dihydroorotate dehydrogenase/Pyruvate/2-oxoacid:ferredoxin oxidoreductase delta subunit
MTKFLTDAQLKQEVLKCEYCELKPCREACPVNCSPADFIMAVRREMPQDYERSAALILGSNPLGGVCGAVCPDFHCMKKCSYKEFSEPIKIPAVQSTIIHKAKDLNKMPTFKLAKPNNLKVAVIGSGPAGLGAAAILAQKGYSVDMYDKDSVPGGMCNLIPDERLDKDILKSDLNFLFDTGDIKFFGNKNIADAEELSKKYDTVIVTTGLDEVYKLNIPNEDKATGWIEFLLVNNNLKNKSVAVIGGGAIAVDCSVTAKNRGAKYVEMLCLEMPDEMPLTDTERKEILENKINVTTRSKADEIITAHDKIKFLKVSKVYLPDGEKFHPSKIRDDKESGSLLRKFDEVIIAAGSRGTFIKKDLPNVFYAGDFVNGPSTVVEAVASGKNAAAEADAYMQHKEKPVILSHVKNRDKLDGLNLTPVSTETDFFGRKIISPFILSAAPPSDGYEQMKKAYEAGWAGGVMKTSFDNVPIHIPSEYMFAVTQSTYGNCDNVSGHKLDRVCSEVERLIKEFPDRLTLASTGGPVTGDDKRDSEVWQSNTLKLEKAGAMGIEYSLSCPQGGDGTKGDIVSQDAELTAKVIDWVMQVSEPSVPKLFKLTAAVTSIYPIISAIKEVFAKYPGKKAGVTLANTFPSMAFRKMNKKSWEEGVVIGLSGEGVIPISNLTLANVSSMGVIVSGNGGPMDYKAAADFLALGVKTVQFCTIVMKYGYGIIDELNSGLSYLMKERGYTSVSELIGCALPNPITGFMELPSKKKISDVNKNLCEHCGNCTRCPYLAITLNEVLIPVTDASRCIGCSICVQKCFAGALYMRERTEEELNLINEE